VKKWLIQVPLAAMLCLSAAAPAAAQATAVADQTAAAGTTITNPGYTVPYGVGDPRLNTRRDNVSGTYSDNGNGFINGYSNGFNAGTTGTGTRTYNSTRMTNTNDGIMNRVDTGVTDVNRAIRRTTNAMRVRANAADNNAGNWGWLGLLGLIGLAGMFRGGNREQHRT
jgi:hypothetical protein